MTKYSFKAYKNSSHQAIAGLLNQAQSASILDLGCDQGFIGRLLTYSPKKMEGVDIKKIKLPKNYTRIWEADLETSDLKFLKGKFEAIILADILEHLTIPGELLIKIRPRLKKGGKVIISVPNGSFWLVRLLLSLGIKPQMDWGPFDKTHQYFFTLASLEKLFKKPQFKIKNIYYLPVPLPQGKLLPAWQRPFFKIIFWSSKPLINFWPQMFAYQIILELEDR